MNKGSQTARKTLMGSVILGSVARRNRNDNKPSSDLNNNLEIGECAREVHLLESPPLGLKHKPINFKPELPTQKVTKIGKIAKISDRKVSGEKFCENQVSHILITPHFFMNTIIVEPDERLKSNGALKKKKFAAAEKTIDSDKKQGKQIMVSLTIELRKINGNASKFCLHAF